MDIIDMDKFHENCGKILRMALFVEGYMDNFLSWYFCFPSQRMMLLNYEVFKKMKFNIKFQIYLKMCKFENIDENVVKNIKKDIKRVQEIRNMVAHSEAYSHRDGIIIRKPKMKWHWSEGQIIDDKIVKEIDEKSRRAVDEMGKLHQELMKEHASLVVAQKMLKKSNKKKKR